MFNFEYIFRESINMSYVTVVGAIALLVVMQYTSVSACDYPTQDQSNSGKYMILLGSLQNVGFEIQV